MGSTYRLQISDYRFFDILQLQISKAEIREISGPGNGCQIATNVVVCSSSCCLVLLIGVLVVIRFSCPYGSIVSQPIVMKLFTHINENILH